MSKPVFTKILSAAALLLVSTIACTDTDKTWRILPLGDSITQAEVNRASYRYPLWKKLVDSEIQFDLVGSMQKQQDKYSKGEPPQPDYKGLSFDRDHEGHFAWAIEEIFIGRDFDNGSGSGKLQEWVQGYDADIVLIHLGTNDAFKRQSNKSSLKDLRTVVEILRADNPEVIVLLAQLIPTKRKPGDAKAVKSLNDAIPQLAKDLSTKESPIIIVDQFSGFDAAADTYDGVHPNERGEEKMAQVWFDAIMNVVESN